MAERRTSSPFPGMDPYLEKYWPSVHAALITYASDDLNARFGGRLIAAIEGRLVVEAAGERRKVYPDVRITGRDRYAGEDDGGGGTATLARPKRAARPLILTATEPIRQRYVELIDPDDGNRLITVIEFVSPSNKLSGGDGRRKYERKRRECYDAGVNFVEIDLTRAGRRRLLAAAVLGEDAIPPEHRGTFAACVYRGHGEGRFEVHAMPLDEPLPDIPVPLRAGEDDEHLPLQSLIARAYAGGAYWARIDYAKPPEPPLSEADAAFARELAAV